MRNKNTGLKVLVIILSISVVALIGYIVYDKVINVENIPEEEQNENTNQNQNISINIDGNIDYTNLINELQSTFKVVYDYYYANGNSYCGTYDWNNGIASSSDSRITGYTASSDFNSYDEMINYLKEYMSEEIIYEKETTNKEFYLEQDGKLYCGNLGKGGNMYEPKDMIIQINSINEDSINVTIAVELSYDDSNHTYKDYGNHEVTFSKVNERYIVTSYTRPNLW